MNFWADSIDIVWHLWKAYSAGNLAIFTGAGVSHGCGLPLWPKLVASLYTESARRNFPGNGVMGTFDDPTGWGGLAVSNSKIVQDLLDSLPLTIRSRYCKRKLGEQYQSALQRVLYADPCKTTPTIAALSKLTRLKAVCTYNYDDILECSAEPGAFVPIIGLDENASTGVPVYHVHGLIPSDMANAPRSDIVFSEDEYHSMYLNFGHWSNMIQLSLLLGSECVLFIGLSFEDPNLRRLLDAAKKARNSFRFYNICRLPFSRHQDSCRYNPMAPRLTQINFLNEIYKDIGVTNLWVDEFEPDIPFVLEALAKDDPIEYFTDRWRAHLGQCAAQTIDGRPCEMVGCAEKAVNGFRSCRLHLLEDQDYAPMKKTLRDTCSHEGCERISAGLSGRCLDHLSECTTDWTRLLHSDGKDT